MRCTVVRRGIGVRIHTSKQASRQAGKQASRRSIIHVSSDQMVRGLAAQAHYSRWYACCLYTGWTNKNIGVSL